MIALYSCKRSGNPETTTPAPRIGETAKGRILSILMASCIVVSARTTALVLITVPEVRLRDSRARKNRTA